MKKMTVSLVAVFLLSLPNSATAQTSTREKQVRQAVQSFYDAFNAHGFERAAEYTTEDWNHINPFGGRARGRAAVLKELKEVHSTFLKGVSDTVENMDVRFATPDVAVVTASSRMSTYTMPDGVKHENERHIRTFAVVKRSGRWLITQDQNTIIGPSVQAQAQPIQTSKDNEELARLYQEDQGDRTPANVKDIDWAVVGPRDKARLARVKELYTQNHLQTGVDYYHAALILQHGDTPEDFLLAHELCIVAISKGNRSGRSLAAASEDRFLMNIGRPQRFGTQYRADPITAPLRLYKVDSGVTDELRRALDVPSLAEAKAREAELNRK